MPPCITSGAMPLACAGTFWSRQDIGAQKRFLQRQQPGSQGDGPRGGSLRETVLIRAIITPGSASRGLAARAQDRVGQRPLNGGPCGAEVTLAAARPRSVARTRAACRETTASCGCRGRSGSPGWRCLVPAAPVAQPMLATAVGKAEQAT